MKLTKDQRFTAYCIMIQEAFDIGLDEMDYGLCKHSSNIFGEDMYHFREAFLEVRIMKKYKDSSGWWWPCNRYGWRKRIELLKQCISETSNF